MVCCSDFGGVGLAVGTSILAYFMYKDYFDANIRLQGTWRQIFGEVWETI